MALIQNRIIADIDPSKPVQELCSVIMAVTAFHPGQEDKVLTGVADAIAKRILELKGADTNAKPVLQPDADS